MQKSDRCIPLTAAKGRRDTPELTAAKRDPAIVLASDPEASRQGWACTVCVGKGGKRVEGVAYIGLIKHVASERHQEEVNEGGALPRVDSGEVAGKAGVTEK